MLKQGLQQKLLQKLSPQQIQLIKLLQIPTDALEERIKEELEGNPALEEGVQEEDNDDELQSVTEDETPDVKEESDGESENETETETEVEVEKEEEVTVETEDNEEEDYLSSDNNDLTDYMDEDEVAEYKMRDENYPEQED